MLSFGNPFLEVDLVLCCEDPSFEVDLVVSSGDPSFEVEVDLVEIPPLRLI